MVIASILSPIEDVLRHILVWLHGSIGLSWAWAIVAVTIFVRVAILPLTVKQIQSMQRLAQHAPELKAIQQKYKHDKQRQQEEIMKFYKENKVNPAASCLPLLPQLPIFFSLYYVLRDFSKTLANDPQSSLEFLNGLVPNITANIKDHWSGILLVVVYGCTTVLSMFLSTTTLQSKAQRYLMLVLPVVFIPVVLRFPVGLLLYWVTTNLWTIGQGAITRRMFPRPQLPAEKKTSRAPAGGKPSPGGSGSGTGKTVKPTAPKPAPKKPTAGDGGGQQRQVRRRKKRGPQARR
jgi:YidC/Oxa1 family membrane protein insertase